MVLQNTVDTAVHIHPVSNNATMNLAQSLIDDALGFNLQEHKTQVSISVYISHKERLKI